MRKIFINYTPKETRVSIMEHNSLAEFLVEREQEKGFVGNIYKGKVSRVLPGMQAAFVDIGLEKAGFLHVSDLSGSSQEISYFLEGNEEDIPSEQTPPSHSSRLPIEQQLHPEQQILVQASKDPLGMKGARITSHISLPSRYLVYMPTMKHVAVSRRIHDEKERKRLKEILQPLVKDQGGFIIRTASEGRSKREILRDFRFLTKLWKRIHARAEKAAAPALIHQDLDLVTRTIRDFFTPDTEEVVVDHPKEHRRVVDFVKQFMPRLRSRVTLYNEPEPIMDHYGIEDKIRKALEPKIWLSSGGSIMIEQTEALTAVDVNTGRYVGKKNLEQTVHKINLEAAREVVHQLRLRNVGGIIIIDFIDMEEPANRKNVYEALKEALKNDKAKTNILQISTLGLVEMTRQRTRENLSNVLLSACPYCQGRGRIKSQPTIAYEILRAVKKHCVVLKNGSRVTVRVHPEIANFLYDEANEMLESVEKETRRKIILKVSPDFHQEQYEIGPL